MRDGAVWPGFALRWCRRPEVLERAGPGALAAAAPAWGVAIAPASPGAAADGALSSRYRAVRGESTRRARWADPARSDKPRRPGPCRSQKSMQRILASDGCGRGGCGSGGRGRGGATVRAQPEVRPQVSAGRARPGSRIEVAPGWSMAHPAAGCVAGRAPSRLSRAARDARRALPARAPSQPARAASAVAAPAVGHAPGSCRDALRAGSPGSSGTRW